MSTYTPLLNDTKVNFSSRDSLGIESVFTSISADLCPIINTVTPRAFYWPFMCWIYYDFYKNSGIKTYTVSEFDKRFLKRQDYYFVLANLITNNPDQFNLVGKQKAAQDAEDNVLKTAQFSVPLSCTLKSILSSCYFSFNDREIMIAEARKKKMGVHSVENGLMLALSIYNRFSDRDDLDDCEKLLDYGKGRVAGRGSLSLNEWRDLIIQYENKTIREFLIHIMGECIINQHLRTCFDKLTRSSNNVYGFYFECMGDLYVKNEYGFQVDFQGNRFVQLMQVMDDLDMFDGAARI